MTGTHWNLQEVAQYLGIGMAETRQLIDLGFLHPEPPDESAMKFDAAAVKDWRRGLSDGGERGAAYVRQLLQELRPEQPAHP